ncbi:hypothetical protein EFE27_06730 [Leuconostoc citreum]|nr:hypothetical protein [Leuconostoc citreum]
MLITIILLTSIVAIIFSVITAFSLGVHVALIQKNSEERMLKGLTAFHDVVVNTLDKKLDYLIQQESNEGDSKRR